MIVKTFLWLLGCCAMIVCTIVAFGQTVDSKMVEADKALSQHVSIPCGHYDIGELLEMLAGQSSVALESGDPNDGGSGMEVTVCLRNLPLSEAMNALYALISYKQHEWRWTRIGKPGHYVYKLTRPFEARTVPAELKAWSQRALEKQAKKLIDALQMSAEELKKAAEKDSLLKILTDSPRAKDGIYEFSTLFSPETQAAVLRGSASPKVQVSQLDARGQQFVHDIWKKAEGVTVRPDGSSSPTPEPTWIQFSVSTGDSPAPSMYIDIEHQGGYGYFGGNPLENDFHDYFNGLWLLPGDNAHVEMEQQTLKPKAGIVLKDTAHIMEERLGQLSEATPLSFMARLPENQVNDPTQLAGIPLGKILSAFRGPAYELQSKWRAGTLLLTDDRLYLEESSDPAPWIAVKHLRSMRERSKGLFAWADLVELSYDYDAGMLQRLGKEFPVTKFLLECRDLFRSFYRETYRTKQLFSKEGLPLIYVENLLDGTPFARLLYSSATGKKPLRIRATEKQITLDGKRANMIDFESLDETGAGIKKAGFYNVEK